MSEIYLKRVYAIKRAAEAMERANKTGSPTGEELAKLHTSLVLIGRQKTDTPDPPTRS